MSLASREDPSTRDAQAILAALDLKLPLQWLPIRYLLSLGVEEAAGLTRLRPDVLR